MRTIDPRGIHGCAFCLASRCCSPGFRLTTLNETDCIFVFDQGRVVEQGAFDNLVENNGVFAELVRSAEAA